MSAQFIEFNFSFLVWGWKRKEREKRERKKAERQKPKTLFSRTHVRSAVRCYQIHPVDLDQLWWYEIIPTKKKKKKRKETIRNLIKLCFHAGTQEKEKRVVHAPWFVCNHLEKSHAHRRKEKNTQPHRVSVCVQQQQQQQIKWKKEEGIFLKKADILEYLHIKYTKISFILRKFLNKKKFLPFLTASMSKLVTWGPWYGK